MNYIFSPCGTSLLTNKAKNEEKSIVTKNSNVKSKEEIPLDNNQREILENLIRRARSEIEKSNKEQAKKLSAELNGIITLYEKNLNFQAEQEIHYLIATDTYLGSETAKMIKSWLEKNYSKIVQVLNIKRLQTKNYSDFKSAMSELTKRIDDIIKGIERKHNKIIFNLTGGFKSVQGYLQALGMIWNVDEIIYIFEQSSELISIPKLPIKLDSSVFKDEHNIKIFRKIDLGLKISPEQVKKLPQTLIEEAGNIIDFSNWGKVLWGNAKPEIYSEKIHEPPTSKIEFSKNFIQSTKKYLDRYAEINQKIDDLAIMVETKDKNSTNIKSLDMKPLKGDPCPPATHEIDAWHDQDAKRIYLHYVGDKIQLDKLDNALH